MNKQTAIASSIATLAIIGGIATYLLLGHLPQPLQITSTLAVTLFFFHSGAATMFLMALGNFKERPKAAYRLIALSIVLLALSQLQLLFSSLFNLWHVAWFQFGGLLLPYILSGLFMYLGVRKFALLLDLKGKLLSLKWVLGLSFLLIVVSSFFPHVALSPGVKESAYDMAIAATTWDVAMFGVVWIVLVKLKKVISPSYLKAIAWLILGTVSAVVGTGIFLLAQLGLPADHWYREYRVTMLYVLLSGITYVLSARAFGRVYIDAVEASPTGERTFFGNPKTRGAAEERPEIAALTYVAGLAANYKAIDPLLEPLRSITARSNQALTAKDQQELEQLYLKLEKYLIETEAVHKFTKDDLRQRVLARVPQESSLAKTLRAGMSQQAI